MRGTWHATTVATESATQPGEWGYYAACRLSGGEYIGAMLDTQAPSGPSRYLVAMKAGIRDAARSRPGGPKRANDPRGTGLPANALLYDNGWLAVRPFVTIEPLRPGKSPAQRKRREVLYHYSEKSYWERHEQDIAWLPPALPRTMLRARRSAGVAAPRKRAALRRVVLRLRGAGDDAQQDHSASASQASAAEEHLSAYELLRLERVRENNAVLAALGLVPLSSESGTGRSSKQHKRRRVEAPARPPRSLSLIHI